MRQEIVDALESAGPCSIAALAAILNRPADSLYFHIRRLLKVGLVIESDRRKDGRHVFAMYDVCARPLQLTYDPPVRRADIARVVGAALRLGIRDFNRALSDSGERWRTSGPARELWGGRAKGWVTPDQLTRINALIGELLALTRGGSPDAPNATPVSLGFVLAPAPAVRARKAGKLNRSPRQIRSTR
jgi:DNA-binding transcriptional ArsR family regulator